MIGDELTLVALAADPHPHLARLRASTPVARVPAVGGVMVTGRAAALDVLRDPTTFTVHDPRFSTAQVVGASMLSLDGPQHARHRDPFAATLRSRRTATHFEAFVAGQVERRVAEICRRRTGRAELRAEVAGPLAASVVAESLGLDGRDDDMVARLLCWYRDIVASVSGVAAGCPVSPAGAAAMAELGAVLREHLASHVGPSLLVDAVGRGGLTDTEAVANAAVIMFGGIETTEGMILNTIWHVLGHPDVQRAVTTNPELASAAVEEALRLEPAAAVVDRYATRTVQLHGQSISAGELVVVSLAGANRDPAEFPSPDRFDLHRPNVRRHLAFAAGPHLCIGADLARLEARVALGAVLTGLPGLALDSDAPPPTGLVFRKPERLPVRWG